MSSFSWEGKPAPAPEEAVGIKQVDHLKLNCEGCEYHVLTDPEVQHMRLPGHAIRYCQGVSEWRPLLFAVHCLCTSISPPPKSGANWTDKPREASLQGPEVSCASAASFTTRTDFRASRVAGLPESKGRAQSCWYGEWRIHAIL